MLLGIVLHSVITYGVIDFGDLWPLKDVGATHLSNTFTGVLIHVFRMQIFFLIAVFFGAMLFYERGPKKMAVNRLKRILLPFIVFILVLWPIIVYILMRLNPPFYTGTINYKLSSWVDFVPPPNISFVVFVLFIYYHSCIYWFSIIGQTTTICI